MSKGVRLKSNASRRLTIEVNIQTAETYMIYKSYICAENTRDKQMGKVTRWEHTGMGICGDGKCGAMDSWRGLGQQDGVCGQLSPSPASNAMPLVNNWTDYLDSMLDYPAYFAIMAVL